MTAPPAIHLSFGRQGNATPHLLQGWSDPEDGYTWSIGLASRLRVASPPGEGKLMLEVMFTPFVAPGVVASQDVTFLVNGVAIGRDRFFSQSTAGYPIPQEAEAADGMLEIEMRHPRAFMPAALGRNRDIRLLACMVWDLRVLRAEAPARADATALPALPVPADRDAASAFIRAETGMDPRSLALCFESLGHNCEFGVFQRHVLAEPLSFLRFAGIGLDHLLHGLREGFAGVGTEISVRTEPNPAGKLEYQFYEERYRIHLHAFRTVDDMSAAEATAELVNRLQFTHRQFMRVLASGERLFVFQRPGRLPRSLMLPLLTLLRQYGPNGLLYVDQDPRLPSGAVEQLAQGLFHGKLDVLAPEKELARLDEAGWLSICANAHKLWTGQRAKSVVA
jgi:hypothetical protein